MTPACTAWVADGTGAPSHTRVMVSMFSDVESFLGTAPMPYAEKVQYQGPGAVAGHRGDPRGTSAGRYPGSPRCGVESRWRRKNRSEQEAVAGGDEGAPHGGRRGTGAAVDLEGQPARGVGLDGNGAAGDNSRVGQVCARGEPGPHRPSLPAPEAVGLDFG